MRHLRRILPFLLIAIVTSAAYWNARTDALVVDDKMFAGRAAYSDLADVPEFFRQSVWSGAGDDTNSLYRPLLLVSFAVDATLFPDRAEIWHAENVLLHVAATLLLYVLLLQLLRRSLPVGTAAVLAAALAATIFGVHPVHAEVVNSIFNRSAIFVVIGSAAGLAWLLRYLDTRPFLAWASIWLLYWPVLFSRETGIVLPALAVLLVWICTAGGWQLKVRRCLPALSLAVPMVVYLILRAQAVVPTPPENAGASDVLGLSDLVISGGLPDWYLVTRLASVWLEALRLFLWPQPLLLNHSLPDQEWWPFALGVHLALVAAALYLYRRGWRGPVTGLGIFYIALLPTSHLFGSGGTSPHLFERYLYEPSVGLAVLLAFGLSALHQRGDRLLAAAPALLAICLLTPLTWARNADWRSDVRLLEHEYRHGMKVRRVELLQAMTAGLVVEGNVHRAVEVCRENAELLHESGYLSLNCATAYAKAGDTERAEQGYLIAASDEASRARAFDNLTFLLLSQGRLDEIAAHLEPAIAAEHDPAMRAYLTGLLLIRVYFNDRTQLYEAREQFAEALRLRPGFLLARQSLELANQILEDPL